MKNTNNPKLNTFIFSLGILAILFMGVTVLPTASFARTYGTTCGNGGCNYNFETSPGQGTTPTPTPAPVIYPTYTTYRAPTPTIYSNSTGPKTTVSTTTVRKVTATPKTNPTQDLSNLSANAVYGSNSFLPSGLIQWILLAILILIIIILARKVSGAEDKYHSEPLKHA